MIIEVVSDWQQATSSLQPLLHNVLNQNWISAFEYMYIHKAFESCTTSTMPRITQKNNVGENQLTDKEPAAFPGEYYAVSGY